ncbi:MAG: hypothetical protein Q4G39_06060, partial [Brachymonas sp.]|nr:hypothetical protein [Brachymonas sp.]
MAALCAKAGFFALATDQNLPGEHAQRQSRVIARSAKRDAAILGHGRKTSRLPRRLRRLAMTQGFG